MARLTLVTRPGCHLCEEAARALDRIGEPWTELNVESDIELEREYGDRVPVVLLDGREPTDVTPGVPTDATTTLRLAAADVGRPVIAMFNLERIVVRAWPLAENRVAIAELTS